MTFQANALPLHSLTLELLEDVCGRWGSPVHLLVPGAFRQRCDEVSDRLQSTTLLCYSAKSNPWLVEQAKDKCRYVEACSTGEVRLCLAAGLPPDRILGGGVCMRKSDFDEQIALGVTRFSIESTRQAAAANQAAHDAGIQLLVTLRLSNGNQFGMSLQTATELCADRHSLAHLRIDGLRFYAGTQQKSPRDMSANLDFVNESVRLLEANSGICLKQIQFGPGLGVPYFHNDNADRYRATTEVFFAGLESLGDERTLVVELGRYLAAGSGYYVCKVVDIKPRSSGGWFVVVDGGRHHLALHGHAFGTRSPLGNVFNVNSYTGVLDEVVVCGALCTSTDILASWSSMRVEVGDYIVFKNTGAYTLTESPSLFLSRDLAPIVEIDTTSRLRRPAAPTWHINYSPENRPLRLDWSGNE